MTIKELREITKCPIFIEWTDTDGATRRTEWRGATRDYKITSLKIGHMDLIGFGLAVEIEEAEGG